MRPRRAVMSELERSQIQAYEDWSKRSGELAREARRYFPGGDTRASAHYAPYPISIERGEGCRVFDVDGHELIDFMNNFTSLLLGHAHPAVVAAVTEQVKLGTAHAAPSRSQIGLARNLCERVPSLEQVRFCSSGTEATLMTLRAARAFTGRQRIMKMEGGYHGSYELAEVSLVPFPNRAGPLEQPLPVPIDPSIPESALRDTIPAPYNEPEIAVRLIEQHADELAAVIVEPVLGSMGMIPASREFLQALRDVTARLGILLVFDEVITLRLGHGGMQEVHGIAPDLTSMGKIIGGGLPIGAFGGREEIMRLFNPEGRNSVFHASTFSGNALSMAAGLAAMPRFTPEECSRLNALGDRLRDGFNRAFEKTGVRGQAVGAGSLLNVHLTDRPLSNARDSLEGIFEAGPMTHLLHLAMVRRGINSASRLMYCMSTPMGESEIDTATAALEDALIELRPGLESERPALLC
jgi:glutamate-1-semialdehyde 2,1-aminomutase